MATCALEGRTVVVAGAGQTVFTFTFDADLIDDGDVVLWFEDVSAGTPGAEATQGAGAGQFSVDRAAKTCTLVTPAEVDDRITMERHQDAATRKTTFVNPGDFIPETVNDEFDHLLNGLNDLQRDRCRSVRMDRGVDLTGLNLELLTPVQNKVLGWVSTTQLGHVTDISLSGDITAVNITGTGILTMGSNAEVITNAVGKILLASIEQGGAGAGQRLEWNGTVWAPASGAGTVDGSGTANKLTKWIDADTIGDSILSESGAVATVTGSFVVTGVITAASDADGTFTFGRARIGSPVSNVAYFSHFDNMGATTFALKQLEIGDTAVNTKSGRTLILSVGGVTEVGITGTTFTVNSNDVVVAAGDVTVTAGVVNIGAVTLTALGTDTLEMTASDSTFNSFTIGTDNTVHGVLAAYGDATGSTVGGLLTLYTAADHDGSIDTYHVSVDEDDLLIGPITDLDSLKYDGSTNVWEVTEAGFTITVGDLHVTAGSIGAGNAAPNDLFQAGTSFSAICMGKLDAQFDGVGGAYVGFNAFATAVAGVWDTVNATLDGGVIHVIPSNTDTGTRMVFGFVDQATAAESTAVTIQKSGAVGFGINPLTNMAAGQLVLEGGVLVTKETTTPTADPNYGKWYTKLDNKAYFQDGAGAEHEIAFV